jgi:hypothetical protein
MDVVVKTRYGEVRGSVVEGVNTFKGTENRIDHLHRVARLWQEHVLSHVFRGNT